MWTWCLCTQINTAMIDLDTSNEIREFSNQLRLLHFCGKLFEFREVFQFAILLQGWQVRCRSFCPVMHHPAAGLHHGRWHLITQKDYGSRGCWWFFINQPKIGFSDSKYVYIYINRFQTPCLTKERVFFKLSKAWSSWPMQTPFTKHNTQPLAVMTEYGQRGASMAGWHSTDVMIKCPKLHSWIHSIQRISVKALNPTKLCCNPKRLSKDCPWLGYHDITYATCVFLFETSVNLDHTLPGSSFLAPHALLAARWSKGGDWGR